MLLKFLTLSFLFVLLTVGCAVTDQPICTTKETQAVNDLLYFGTAKPIGLITAEEWSAFLRSSVTPLFPQGFTVWQGLGQWQDNNDVIVHEPSYILNLIHPGDERSENGINAIIAEYKAHFKQKAVLRVKNYACTSF